MCNLGLSGSVVGVLLGRLLEKGLLAKPDKYQYGLIDKLFIGYILRYGGYNLIFRRYILKTNLFS